MYKQNLHRNISLNWIKIRRFHGLQYSYERFILVEMEQKENKVAKSVAGNLYHYSFQFQETNYGGFVISLFMIYVVLNKMRLTTKNV